MIPIYEKYIENMCATQRGIGLSYCSRVVQVP